jgi:hypothetical protein
MIDGEIMNESLVSLFYDNKLLFSALGNIFYASSDIAISGSPLIGVTVISYVLSFPP